MMNEQDLVQQSKNGHQEAFACLVHRYRARVFSLALRMVGDPSVAEDITQEAFLSAYRKLHTFQAGSFRAWLFRIAVNACRDYLRSPRHRRDVSWEALEGNPQGPYRPPDASPEDRALAREVADLLHQGLRTLPPDQRALLLLVDVEGLAYEEAAQALRLPLGTVKSRLSRARSALRSFLLQHKELLPEEFRLD